MTREGFEAEVLERLGGIEAKLTSHIVRFEDHSDKVDSDIRELKADRKATHDSVTDLRMETIRADAIIAKAKWEQVKAFGVGVLKALVIAAMGGALTHAWTILHR